MDPLAAALASPAEVRELDLSGRELTAIPPAIKKLVDLEILRVDDNALTELPEALTKLKKLRELHAANNQITSEGIHRAVWFIKTLEVLNLHGNRLAWVDNLGNYQKSPLSLYLGANPLDPKAYKMGGSAVHPLWKHVLHMFPLTTYGKPKLRALALDIDQLAFPLPKQQLHFEPPFPHVERIQLYGKLGKTQRDELVKMFPKATIEVHAKATGPHVAGSTPPAPTEPLPPKPRQRAWHPEQAAFRTKLLAAAKAKKHPLDTRAVRPCLAIATRPPKKRELRPGSSRIGGLPDLPEKLAWPLREGKPLLFVAQLRLEDLAPYDPEALLPPRGLLSFFVADFEDPEVLFVEDTTALVERSPSKPMRFGGMKWKAYEAAALELAGEACGLSDDGAELIRRTAKRERFIHRVLGYDFGDTDQFDDDLVLLLAIGSDDALDMNWGDAGTMYYVIARDALARRDFTKVELLHTM